MIAYKYLHLMNNDKFIAPFITFIKENFQFNEHYFLIVGGIRKDAPSIPNEKNVIYLDHSYSKIYNYYKLSKIMTSFIENSQKIFFHSLFKINIMNYFLFNQKYLKKSYWIIWGSDLYSLLFPKRTVSKYKQLEYKISEYRKKIIVKKMIGIICYNLTEYKIAEKYALARGKFIESFFYPSNLYYEVNMPSRENKKTISIQIGNSADPTNNHIEVLKMLQVYKKEDIHIYLPLSYGDDWYRDEVVAFCEKNFTNKYTALTDFMILSEYHEFLSTIDIAIFNHNQQQAVGNITTLLGLGKKVYINSYVSTWDLMTSHHIKVYDTQKFELSKISDEIMLENIASTKKYFSLENLISQWSTILYSRNEIE